MIRIACFSDTHTLHNQVVLPECDIALFAGDMCRWKSEEDEIESFLSWFETQDQAKEKVYIAGNHDHYFDPDFTPDIITEYCTKKYSKLHYLCNSSIELFGLKIWGSPITPDFYPENWAFNRSRGKEIAKIWDRIPSNVDILVTHGPAFEIFDWTNPPSKPSEYPSGHVGCKDLLQKIKKLSNLKLHVGGNIHNNNGSTTINSVQFVNSACCGHMPFEQFKYQPILVEVDNVR